MKTRHITFAGFALTALAGYGVVLGQTDFAVPQSTANLIMNERNMPTLNARNLGERRYDIIAPSEDALQFRFGLKGYVFGIRMIKANYTGYVDPDDVTAETGRYAAYADIKTSGLGALLKKLEIWAVTSGRFDKDGLHPDFHVQQNMDGKERRVEMNYDTEASTIDVNIIPTLGSQGVPPASPEERFSADDTISAVLNLMLRGERIGGELCDGTVRTFDSKQHYGLRMERDGTKTRKFGKDNVQTVRCKVYYEPINGFDPEDLPSDEEGSTPVTVYFVPRPDLGLNIPLRFTYKISAIKAVIKLDEWEIIAP